MPRIIKFSHGSSQDIQSNIFQALWSFFLSRDYFTKSFLLILLLIIIATPFIISNRFDIRQRAATLSIDSHFGVAGCHSTSAQLNAVGSTWCYEWAPIAIQNRPDYHTVPMFNLGPVKFPNYDIGAKVDEIRQGTTGNYYLVGNEPNLDTPDSDGAGATQSPNDAQINQIVDQFETLVNAIRSRDPGAKIAAPGIAAWGQNADGSWVKGRDWMNRFVQLYQQRFNKRPPIDVLTIHIYDLVFSHWGYTNDGKRLTPHDANMLTAELHDFRTWADNNGYFGIPIWVTEFSMLDCRGDPNCGKYNHPQVIATNTQFLTTLINYFHSVQDQFLLQRWFIFIDDISWAQFADDYPTSLYRNGQVSNYGTLYSQLSAQWGNPISVGPTPTQPPPTPTLHRL